MRLAQHLGFDGWFVNIEHTLDRQDMQPLLLAEFVGQLTEAVHAAIPHGQVIW